MTAYIAMARRYRPQQFDQVRGQEHVSQTLKNALINGRVAHAYLFCGPRGCGKTSMARIFAQALVCVNGPTPTPCGVCEFCTAVKSGQDVDVNEIDGASNNSVAEVRVLRDQASYVPVRARFKIFIIDEVHMLSTPAFNALLKTLEEPRAHVKFILATTDPQKIPGKVLSRVQRFDFRLVAPSELASYFKELAQAEHADITDDALAAVAAFSGGSVRDGLSLLDQILSFSQGTVTREAVEALRGVAPTEAVAGLFVAIQQKDLKNALEIIDNVSRRGVNVGDYLEQIIAFGRDWLRRISLGPKTPLNVYGPARNTLEQLAQNSSLEQVILILDCFCQARLRIASRALTNPIIALEMAVARLAGLDDLTSVNNIIASIEMLAEGLPLPTPLPLSVSSSQLPATAMTIPVIPESPLIPTPAAVPIPEQILTATPFAVSTPEKTPVRTPVTASIPEKDLAITPITTSTPEPTPTATPVAPIPEQTPTATPVTAPITKQTPTATPVAASTLQQTPVATAIIGTTTERIFTSGELQKKWPDVLNQLSSPYKTLYQKTKPTKLEKGILTLEHSLQFTDRLTDTLRMTALRNAAIAVYQTAITELDFVEGKRQQQINPNSEIYASPVVKMLINQFGGFVAGVTNLEMNVEATNDEPTADINDFDDLDDD